MASWITVLDVHVRLLAQEKTVMDGLALQQTLQQCVDDAANFCRGYVPPPKEAAPAVPPEVVDDVVAIARVNYLSEEPSGTLLTEARQKERDRAVSHLKDIANGKVSITAPDVPIDNTQGGEDFEKITGNVPVDTRQTLDGLL